MITYPIGHAQSPKSGISSKEDTAKAKDKNCLAHTCAALLASL
jgi:hypothetical protein